MSDPHDAPAALPEAKEARLALRRAQIGEALGLLRTNEWAFLSVVGFLLVSAISTSHADLLVGKQLDLPLISVGVSLTNFYAAAPVVVLVTHASLLGSYFTLFKMFDRLRDELRGLPAAHEREQQSLLGPAPELELVRPKHLRDDGPRGRLHRSARFALVGLLAPFTLLVLQLKFAPYQSPPIGAWQFLTLALDVVATALFWPYLSRRDPLGARDQLRRLLRLRKPVVLSGWVIAGCSFLLLGAVAAGVWPARLDLGGLPSLAIADQSKYLELDNALLEQRQEALMADDPLAPELAAAVSRSTFFEGSGLDLRRRRLIRANLSGLPLVQANLAGADLRGAVLDGADLRGANLADASLAGAHFDSALFQLANLKQLDARGAIGRYADFSAAKTFCADFGGSDLRGSAFYALRMDDPGPWPGDHQVGFCPPVFRDADVSGTSFLGTGDVPREQTRCNSQASPDFSGAFTYRRWHETAGPEAGGAASPSEVQREIARARLAIARYVDPATFAFYRQIARNLAPGKISLEVAGDASSPRREGTTAQRAGPFRLASLFTASPSPPRVACSGQI